MKKTLLYLSTVLTPVLSIQAAVTITDAQIRGYQTAGSADITSAGILGLLVLDSGGDGFGQIQDGSSIALDNLIGDGNDVILNIVGSSAAAPPFNPAQISGVGIGTVIFDLVGDRSSGDEFAVYWFPTLLTSETTFTAGDTYGVARGANWILPGDGNSTISPVLVTSAGAANLTVAAVPEPSSVALLGLGSAVILLRRRRK